jgi:hypothetical protein
MARGTDPMQPYRNLSRASGVEAYQLGPDWILVRFRNGTVYRYTCSSAGAPQIARMHALAETGRGLATFISQYIGDGYEQKFEDCER